MANLTALILTLVMVSSAQASTTQTSPIQAAQNQDNLVSKFFTDKPPEINIAKLFSLVKGRATIYPWSGSYWPTFRLGIAERYEDPSYPTTRNYADFANFYSGQKTPDFRDQKALDALSPAEKYDLLMNDSGKTLTKYSIAHGATAYPNGVAQKWFGLCHGWAAASYMVPRPRRAFDIQVHSNLKLRFFPDDVKALATLLWANTHQSERIVGKRCRNKDVDRNTSGHLLKDQCFDINPGSWHVVMLNHIGISKKNLIIDTTYNLEVWNQPVRAYMLSYFNPKTNQPATTLEEASVLRKDFPEDKFSRFRSPQTKSIIGVSMEIEYVKETNALQSEKDDESEDFSDLATYNYDIELDARGNIIGGEWHQDAHPDFIWTPFDSTDPKSIADSEALGEWTSGAPPIAWLKAAQKAAAKGQPLAKVLKKLVKLAQDEVN